MPTRVLIILVVLAVVFIVVSIVDCALQPASRHRGVSKRTWMLIVIFLPVFGGLLWFIVGRGRGQGAVAPRSAPDDNPEFLGSLGSISDQDERIRRLEEELAKLDEEDGSPATDAPQVTDELAKDDDDESGSKS